MADSSFQQEFLATHNALRKKHKTQPMVLDDELTASAQKWADHLLAINTLEHSKTKDGENVFTMYSSETITLTGKEAVESWYSEIKDYNWGSPGFGSDTGHFTQVVWKESTQLGVGLATNGNQVYVVGQYRPAGNMNTKEYFEKNVLPLVCMAPGGLCLCQRLGILLMSRRVVSWGISSQTWIGASVRRTRGTFNGINAFILQELPPHCGHMRPVTILHQDEPRAHCTSVRSDSRAEDFIPCKPALICEENGAPMTDLPILVFSPFIITDTMADSSFQQEFLATHNALRKKHKTQPMVLDDELTASAQKWADHLLAINTLEHSKTKDGENVFTMYSSETITLTGKEAVESWYSEIKDYDWGSPGFGNDTGHFTQVVWKESTQLGVGLATDGNQVYVVGQYRPAGNMDEEECFEKNVLPLVCMAPGGLCLCQRLGILLMSRRVVSWGISSQTWIGASVRRTRGTFNGINAFVLQELPPHCGHMRPVTILHQDEPRAHCTSVRSDSRAEDFIPVPNSSQGTVGFDMECEPALICEENGAPTTDLPILVFSHECQSSFTVLGCEHRSH
ncbi:uncharacterized protein [Pagrus major]|uniref:uncharacterized protein n=1 Tax=Pagrus major TaxID=143350 RepID=UPI003CC88392